MPALTSLGVFSIPRFSGQTVTQRSQGAQVLTRPRFSGQVVTERYMLYVASGNIFWLLGLNDNKSQTQPAYVTGATVTGQVQTLGGSNVGSPVSMTYVSGSVTLTLPNGQTITSAGGNYQGELPYTTPLTDGTNYELQVVATYGGDQQTFRGPIQAGYSLQS